MFIEISQEQYEKAGVRPVCGVTFLYNPEDPGYGISFSTENYTTQLKNLHAAAKVGAALQHSIFGNDADIRTATYKHEEGSGDYLFHDQ